MAKAAYIGISNVVCDDEITYDGDACWSTLNDVVDTTGFNYTNQTSMTVEIDGTAYHGITLYYESMIYSASFSNFSLEIESNGVAYLRDSSGALDVNATHYLKIYKGNVESVARKIKKGYVGVETEIPVYQDTTTTLNITASNISQAFTVTNGTYYFAGSGGTFTSNNYNVKSSTATTTLTAKNDMTVSFDYSYSTEASYDKFSLTVAGTSVASGVSGVGSSSWSGSLKAGKTIVFTYTKDASANVNGDICTFSNMVVKTGGKTQVGTVIKGVASKIKKAYIGIGGVARPCWSGGELTYYGKIANLNVARGYMGATTLGDYALFGGGRNGSNGYSYIVDCYDKSLKKTSLGYLSNALGYLAATTVGDYALFGGGENSSVIKSTVDAFDTSLTRTNPTSFESNKSHLAATTVGDYALFGGGQAGSDFMSSVDAYSTSLSKTIVWGLSYARSRLAATTIGDYALFAGGLNSSTFHDHVGVYDKSLTAKQDMTLSVARSRLAATTIGDYALFAGGEGNVDVGYVNIVDAYNKSLTRTTPIDLSVARSRLAATTIGDYALFAGGQTAIVAFSNVVDVYDASLTKTTGNSLSASVCGLGATTVGNYALFAGGSVSTGYYPDVNAYTIS